MSEIKYATEMASIDSDHTIYAVSAVDNVVGYPVLPGVNEAATHQVAVTADGGATGVFNVLFIPRGMPVNSFDHLQYVKKADGSTLTVDLADGNQTIQFDAVADVVAFSSNDTVTGTGHVVLAGW